MMIPNPLTEPSGEAAARASSDSAVPTRAVWEARGADLVRVASTSCWSLGDWILQGETAFGATYTLAAELTGIDETTLRNYRSVAARFDLSRRLDNLSFAHHAAVASLPPAEADALLSRAESESLSVRALRELAAPRKPVAALDLRTEILSGLLRDAASERKRLASVPGADRARAAHEQYVIELEALRGAQFEDVASAEDMRSGRYGRRV